MAARAHPPLTVRATIELQLRCVAAEYGKTLVPLTDELELLELGLDSLSFAVVVMSLEELLGVDPFSSGGAVKSPVTFGDFVRMYESFVPECAR